MQTLDDYSIEGESELSTITTDLLKKGNKWIKIFSTTCFIAAGIYFLYIVGVYTFLPYMGKSMIVMIFLPFSAILLIVPAILLNQYAKNINRFVDTKATGELELAFSRYKQFWRFCGIVIIFFMLFIFVLGITIFGVMH
jgi:hypothetical protein